MMIVNNTCTDISIAMPLIKEYAETDIINEDIADIFSLYKVEVNGETRVIVDFLDD